MAKLTPQQFQEKHARRLKASLDDIASGVRKVTEAPTLKAAAKQDKMRANLIKSIDDGKWKAGLERVTLDDWKKQMLEKGVGNISRGIDAAASKVVAFAEKLLPHVEEGQRIVANMPDLTLEESIQRSAAFIRHMADFKR